ncbi:MULTISPECIES: hypothetical protein [unclassified Roseitalea]|uniref:hypothetical protein n=1 Tax=unclassified Roseitalea TaxID=2639107 RepID=UPI00273E9455|nr:MULTISPECIES: hypothetical protein [unclassified Roseitalea]
MTDALSRTEYHAPIDARPFAIAAWATLGLTGLVVIALLVLPVPMPIGAMYWDTFLYPDAAHRIALGQLPNVDFFTPVGPLDYFLYALVQAVFPGAHPLLAASWAVAPVTIPAMALVTLDVTRRDPLLALALIVPFAVYTVLPFNTSDHYVFPGADGFGIYNRHASQLLYVLAATLIFVRGQWLQTALITALMLALFLVKITGFAAGGLLCLLALVAGRVRLLSAVVAAAIFLLALAALQAATGITAAYLADILALLAINDASLALRLVQGASRTGGTVIFAGLLALALLVLLPPRASLDQPAWRASLDHPVVWLGAALIGGIFFESQNTGSQELIVLWPVVLLALRMAWLDQGATARTAVIALLAACTVLPPLVQTIQHAARASFAMVRQEPLIHDHLKSLGRVTVRPRWIERHERMRAHYLEYPQVFRALADRRELPAYVLYSEHDFQFGLLRNADELVGRLKELEAGGLDYQTVMTLDFANPFPWLLDKQAPRHIAIGADPYRAVPEPDAQVLGAIGETDIVLEPQCPYRDNSRELRVLYAEALTGHVKVELTPCYRAYVQPRIAAWLSER